ncbi:TfoX/Sxy family protein [Chitinophaga sp. Cy-1792]|uniref:TfoX/Sxy family protein n=1 Tax=Chitinophaga sp. Cy-1792 TaxID=2608339 RepID=UPI001423A3D7|nr:TfoX/Sxy family protein [Chitinophaga sp. Cy-1792]NIG55796.1 TfoX/Sxy family protein [Chitinophaga sp. Cy-1792]
MAYDSKLADRVREYLSKIPGLKLEEKMMFGGLAFMINGKMCVNVSRDQLMCRFDPAMTEELSLRLGYEPMIMNGKEYKGYCYVDPIGFKRKDDFEFWLQCCLDFNSQAKSSKTKSTKKK